jgi:hypothetical protein
MAAIWMQKRNGGLYPTDAEGEDILSAMVVPEVCVEVKPGDLRSISEERLFFKVLRDVWDCTQKYKDKYSHPEQLRAHLLMQIGHSDIQMHETKSKDEARRLGDALRQNFDFTRSKGKYGRVVYSDDGDKYFTAFEVPKSLKRIKLGQHKFNVIVNQVFDKIHEQTNISVDDLRMKWEAELSVNGLNREKRNVKSPKSTRSRKKARPPSIENNAAAQPELSDA